MLTNTRNRLRFMTLCGALIALTLVLSWNQRPTHAQARPITNFASVTIPLLQPSAQGACNTRITVVDDSQFPKVSLLVAVLDANGGTLPVAADGFKLTENGQSAAVNVGGNAGPVTIILVVDVSGSMADAGKIDAARDAANRLVGVMRSSDQLGIVTFSNVPSVRIAPTSDKTQLLRIISNFSPDAGTALFDGVVTGITQLKGITGRRLVMVMTDGMDNQSTNSVNSVIAQATNLDTNRVQVYTIGLGSPGESLDDAALRQIATGTNADYTVTSPSSLQNLFTKIFTQVTNEYQVQYVSPNGVANSQERNIELSVNCGNSLASANGRYNPGGIGVVAPTGNANAAGGDNTPLIILATLGGLALIGGLMIAPRLMRAGVSGSGTVGGGTVSGGTAPNVSRQAMPAIIKPRVTVKPTVKLPKPPARTKT